MTHVDVGVDGGIGRPPVKRDRIPRHMEGVTIVNTVHICIKHGKSPVSGRVACFVLAIEKALPPASCPFQTSPFLNNKQPYYTPLMPTRGISLKLISTWTVLESVVAQITCHPRPTLATSHRSPMTLYFQGLASDSEQRSDGHPGTYHLQGPDSADPYFQLAVHTIDIVQLDPFPPTSASRFAPEQQ